MSFSLRHKYTSKIFDPCIVIRTFHIKYRIAVVMKYSWVGKLNATTCHHHQKIHSWTHQFLIELAIFFLLLLGCHLSTIRISSRPCSSVCAQFPLDKFSLHCCALLVSVFYATLCTRRTHASYRPNNNMQMQNSLPIPITVRSSVHPFARYIWFNHVVFAKYRHERHRYSQFTLLPTKSVCPHRRSFQLSQIIIIIVDTALFVRNERQAMTTSTICVMDSLFKRLVHPSICLTHVTALGTTSILTGPCCKHYCECDSDGEVFVFVFSYVCVLASEF